MTTRSLTLDAAGQVGGRSRPTTLKLRRGYAASRKAYDVRRRQVSLDAPGRLFKSLLQHDPCGLCPSGELRHTQIAADHIDPLQAGGEHSWENLGAACRSCNAEKGNERLLLFMAGRAPA